MVCHVSLDTVSGLTPRRKGTKFLCEVDGPVDRLEVIERGKWRFIRVHYKDGTAEDIGCDGKPIVTRGKQQTNGNPT